jgi:CPA2 family monovalent cation:H+ antiporter-2
VEGPLFQFALLFAVLGLAAGMSLSLRLPVVPLYIAAGVALGGVLPHSEIVEFLGSLGVVFLLFSMGLEFSTTGFGRDVRGFFGAGTIDWLFNFPIGLLAGRALGLSWLECLYVAGIIYMSSSAVVSKCIADFGRATRPETETILKVLVFEDFVIAVYLVLLNALASSAAGEGGVREQALSLVGSVLFVTVLIFAARRLYGPLERILASRSEEAFTLTLFAFVLLVSSAAITMGLSEEVGAFLAGLILGGTGLRERAGRTLRPFQTLFAALFFVSFGLGLDLARMSEAAVPALLLVVLGLGTKVLGGFLAGRVAGHPPHQAAVVGLSLVPKGEFSIVLAGMAAATAGPASGIEALTGLYVFALSILGPIGMREADRLRALFFKPPGPRRSETRKDGKEAKAAQAKREAVPGARTTPVAGRPTPRA